MAKAKIPDMDSLKSDVASFASSLGFSSSSPSGFNDVDFRKSGRLKPLKNREKPQSGQRRNDTQKPETKTNSAKPKPKQPVLSLDDSIDACDRKHKYKNLPALPLVKAGDLSLWYEDALELEKKVFGEECLTSNRVGLGLLEEKRELGDRLMWRYVKEYETSRGRSGDIKMLMASQRSGTAADKVSAFSFIIADNPVANLRSLDALLGMVTSKVGKRYAFTGFEALKELFISNHTGVNTSYTCPESCACLCGLPVKCFDHPQLVPLLARSSPPLIPVEWPIASGCLLSISCSLAVLITSLIPNCVQ